jgi:hypothetical protein
MGPWHSTAVRFSVSRVLKGSIPHFDPISCQRFVYSVPGPLGLTALDDDSQARSSRIAPVNKNTPSIVIAMADRSSVTPNARNPAMAPNVNMIATAIDASI